MKTYYENQMKQTSSHRSRSVTLILGAGIAAWACGVHVTQVAAAAPDDELAIDIRRSSCCNPFTGACTNISSLQLCIGWQGSGNICLGIQACDFPDGSCQEVDGRCCDDLGGVAGGLGSTCAPPKVCCDLLSEPVCMDLGSGPIICPLGCQCPEGTCGDVRACDFPDGTCSELDAACCPSLGGTTGSLGSTCDEPQACCLLNGACDDRSESDCLAADGNPQGVDTTCANITAGTCSDRACCIDSPMYPGAACVTHSLARCLHEGGAAVPLIPGQSSQGCDAQDDLDGDFEADVCDNCSPSNPAHHCDDPRVDCANPNQEDSDGDGVGDACDNCTPGDPLSNCTVGVDCDNADQVDDDDDRVGDLCDNCLSCPNTDQFASDGDSFGDACDNCPLTADSNQFDCNCDGEGDICNLADPSADNDGDGVPNGIDVCDFTPSLWGPHFVNQSGPLAGTVIFDIDGDCDVDADDIAAVTNFGNFVTAIPGCASGMNVSEACQFTFTPIIPNRNESAICNNAVVDCP